MWWDAERRRFAVGRLLQNSELTILIIVGIAFSNELRVSQLVIRQSSWTQLPVSNNRLNGLYTSICLGHRQLFSRFGGISERHKISHRDLCINNNKVSVCRVDGASSCGLNGPAFELVAESLSVVTSIRTQVSHLDGRQTPPLVSPIIA